MFLDSSHAGVFAVYQVLERKGDANITVGCTYDNIQKLRLFSNGKTEIESDNGSVYFHLPVGTDKITVYITFENLSDFDIAKEYTIAQNEYMQELASISVPEGLNEMEKASHPTATALLQLKRTPARGGVTIMTAPLSLL